MKHLLFFILIAFAIPGWSQDRTIFDPSDHRRSRLSDTGYHSSFDPADHRRYRIRTAPYPRGTIGTIVGGALVSIGVGMMALAKDSETSWIGYALAVDGSVVFLVSAPVFIVNLARGNPKHRYSLFISGHKAGLAYNF